jgi:hypothetical protein
VNLERFEHELVKLKGMVGPEFVGLPHKFTDGKGGHCIMGQIMLNCGVSEDAMRNVYAPAVAPFYGHVWDENGFRTTNEPLKKAVRVAVRMNNAGVPWHQIVDAIVPQTTEVAEEAVVA